MGERVEVNRGDVGWTFSEVHELIGRAEPASPPEYRKFVMTLRGVSFVKDATVEMGYEAIADENDVAFPGIVTLTLSWTSTGGDLDDVAEEIWEQRWRVGWDGEAKFTLPRGQDCNYVEVGPNPDPG